jgi:hydrogenase maturation protein HypF
LNVPLTSSMGRLFDAVAVLAGIRTEVTYEAQASIELEVLSRSYLQDAKAYQVTDQVADYKADKRITMERMVKVLDGEADYTTDKRMIIGVRELLAAVIADAANNEPAGLIGARFHKSIAALAVDVCRKISDERDVGEVALSGGVWQNQILLDLVRAGLEKDGFTVYFHKLTPTNDGGIALGQAAIANFQSANHLPEQ